jgi:hypothetical protein
MSPSYYPATIDVNTPLPFPAIRSQGMDDTTALAVRQAEIDMAAVSMNIGSAIAGLDVTAAVNRAGADAKVTLDWGDGVVTQVIADATGAAVAVHSYARGGVYTIIASTPTQRVYWEVVLGPNPYQP